MSSFGDFLDELLEESGGKLTPGEVVRAHRKRFKMTLKELEGVTGIKENNLSSIENGKIEMTARYAEIFASAFGVHPVAILYPANDFEKTKELKSVDKKMKKYIKRLNDGAA